MAYSDFTLDRARRAFSLALVERDDLFRDVAERPATPHLTATLEENVPIAMAIITEKARSELIVSPVLVEVRRMLEHRVSLFSGIDFSVAPDRGLNGACDFILARSPTPWVFSDPILTVVEAKNLLLMAGLGQCVASMVGAQLFNEREGAAVGAVFSAVTTGTTWQFLRLQRQTLELDDRENHIERIAKILGILTWMLSDEGDRGRLVA